jgi:hypothetical protein
MNTGAFLIYGAVSSPFPSPPCSRTVLAVKSALRRIFSNPEKILLRRAQTPRSCRLRAVPKTYL